MQSSAVCVPMGVQWAFVIVLGLSVTSALLLFGTPACIAICLLYLASLRVPFARRIYSEDLARGSAFSTIPWAVSTLALFAIAGIASDATRSKFPEASSGLRTLVGLYIIPVTIIALAYVWFLRSTRFEGALSQRGLSRTLIACGLLILGSATSVKLQDIVALLVNPNSLWLLVGAAYALTVRDRYALRAFFSGCPWWSPRVRRPAARLLASHSLEAWLVIGMLVLWLVANVAADWGLLVFFQEVMSECIEKAGCAAAQYDFSALSPARKAEIVRELKLGQLGVACALLLIYLLLLVPSLSYSWSLLVTRIGQSNVDTRRRLKVVVRMSPGFVVLVFSASLVAINVIDVAMQLDDRAQPLRDNMIRTVLSTAKPAGLELSILAENEVGVNMVGVAFIVFLVIVFHFLIFVELPFWLGQRRWKAQAVAHASLLVRRSRAKLLNRPRRPVSDSEPSSSLILQFVQYEIACETLRTAKEGPLHTIRSIWDAGGKLARAALLAAATALLHNLATLLANTTGSP